MYKSRVLAAYPLEVADNEVDPTRVFVLMPVGAEVVAIVPNGEAFGVCVLIEPLTALRVRHDLRLARLGTPVTAALGRTLGASLAVIPIGGVPTAVLPELPWPENALGLTTTQGDA